MDGFIVIQVCLSLRVQEAFFDYHEQLKVRAQFSGTINVAAGGGGGQGRRDAQTVPQAPPSIFCIFSDAFPARILVSPPQIHPHPQHIHSSPAGLCDALI